MAIDADLWFPLFEFQNWEYQSFLLLPTNEENDASPGSAITAGKWAKGDFLCGQAFRSAADSYTLSGSLVFRPEIQLAVSAKGASGNGNGPASFEATGTGMEGPTKGAVYQLVGWVFPLEPIQNGAARVLSVKGCIWAVRGPDTRPEVELGGMPVGTVGAFTIVSRGDG